MWGVKEGFLKSAPVLQKLDSSSPKTICEYKNTFSKHS